MAYDRKLPAYVWPVLRNVFSTQFASIWSGRLFRDNLTPPITTPAAVYQSQDNGGEEIRYVNKNSWRGLITFKSIDTTASGSENKLIQFVTKIDTDIQNNIEYTMSGYRVTIDPKYPIPFPVEKNTYGTFYTYGMVCEVDVYNDED